MAKILKQCVQQMTGNGDIYNVQFKYFLCELWVDFNAIKLSIILEICCVLYLAIYIQKLVRIAEDTEW